MARRRGGRFRPGTCPTRQPLPPWRPARPPSPTGRPASWSGCWSIRPLYTAGVSSKPADLIAPDRFPVFESGRGGQFTYHGPGQRVAYVMLDLSRRGRDVRAFVAALETWIIEALAAFNVTGEMREGRVGVWVERKGPGWSREDKIAAIGVKLRRWVSFHGISLNVEPDLEHFSGIVPLWPDRARRHQPGGPGPAGDDGRGRRGVEGGLPARVRTRRGRGAADIEAA
jgi:lipoate-protein ligase B